MRFRLHLAIIPILFLFVASWALESCKDDLGTCCSLISPDAAALPVPDQGDGGPPRNTIKVDPLFNCDSLTCTSFAGSEPVCTQKCISNSSCPEGFECKSVLMAEPGPDASIHSTDQFCVRKRCTGKADCPGGWDCNLVHAGTPGQMDSDPPISECARKEDHCK